MGCEPQKTFLWLIDWTFVVVGIVSCLTLKVLSLVGNRIKNRTFDDNNLQGWLLSNYRSHRASDCTKSLGPSTKYKNDHVPECIHKWFHIWLSLCVLSSFPLFGFAACGIYIHICVYLEHQSHYIKHSTCNRSDTNGVFVDGGWKV